MRAAKQSDSPSGATRDVYPRRDHGPNLEEYGMRVKARARRLLAENPHLLTQDWRGFYSRMVVPATAVDYESALNRAAWGLLLVWSVDRAEMASPFTGDAA